MRAPPGPAAQFGLPIPTVPAPDALIASAPQDQGRVRRQGGHGLLGLHGDLGQHLRRLVVGRAGKHEVVPDQQAPLITRRHEVLIYDVTAAPDSDHVGTPGHGLIEASPGSSRCDLGDEGVVRDPVVSTDPNPTAVDHQMPSLALAIARLVHLGGAQSGASGFAVQHLLVQDQLDQHVIQRLVPVTHRLPHRRCLNRDVDLCLRGTVSTGLRRCRLSNTGGPVRTADRDAHTQSVDVFWTVQVCGHADRGDEVIIRALRAGQNPKALDPPATVTLKFDRTPDASGEVGRAPVPAEVARTLTHVRIRKRVRTRQWTDLLLRLQCDRVDRMDRDAELFGVVRDVRIPTVSRG